VSRPRQPPSPKAAENADCTDVPAPANTYINVSNPQNFTVQLRELATNITRTVQISPGGRVMVQQ
jgi:hypothetical protein